MCSIIFSFKKVRTSVFDNFKKNKQGVEDMQFPGLLKKQEVDFPGTK